MRTVRTVADVRAAVAGARGDGRTPVGLVPTMGALHEGHCALVGRAAQECGLTVVSLFVNPAQFEDTADLARYPRDEERDAALAAEAGADVLFAPPIDEVYPFGFATTVRVLGVSEHLEGAHRGIEHFDGVATVVTKLFNMVGPDVAYFGQKDAQQLAVIRRVVRDLDVDVRVEAVPTVRDADGLALSSRNERLGAEERHRAVALSRALTAAEDAVSAGVRDAATVLAHAHAAMKPFGVEPEYLELVTPDTLDTVHAVDGQVLVVVAARVGGTRLIDNTLIETTAAGGPTT